MTVKIQTRQVNVALPIELVARLDDFVTAENVRRAPYRLTKVDIIRLAIEEYLRRRELEESAA